MSEKDLKNIPLIDKINDKFDLSYLQFFRMVFADRFIPIVKEMKKALGEEKLTEMLKEACCKVAENKVRQLEIERDFDNFKGPIKSKDGFYQHTTTYEIVEDNPKVLEIKVNECLWANIFREAGESEIGYASLCHQDFIAASAFNPKLKLIRDKTLMQGHDCCNHRWVLGE